ncbi:MAG TPA: PstS family phosphate ABC transporter substrate-binding protein [Chroococcidiopsis sp.]
MANGLGLKPRKFKAAHLVGAIATAMTTVGLSVSVALSQSAREIKIDGSSTVYPITEAVAEEFMAQNRGLNVTVGVSGTGGGFSKFCNGETDISNASRPIKATEIEKCRAAGIEYIELPIAYDALTIVVNNRNTWANSMTVDELKRLWEPSAQGTITRWNQIRPNWPNRPIILYGPGSDSGTFDYFTEAIVGEADSSRADYTASEDDNVLVQGVVGDTNALGYFGFSYYSENSSRLKAVSIDNGSGPVAPSSETVENGTYQPLSRPLFIYVSAASLDRPEVRQFVSYYLGRPDLAEEVGYVRLPADAYRLGLEAVENNNVGTVFSGRDVVGVRIEDLLRLERQR